MRSSNLRFGGMHAYHGSAQHRRTQEERRSAIAEAVGKARRTVELLQANGIEVPVVTGALPGIPAPCVFIESGSMKPAPCVSALSSGA